QRVMLMLLDCAQIDRVVVGILDMQADRRLVELAAELQVGHIKHRVAGADDVEGRVEDVLRYGHVVSPPWSFRGDAKHRTMVRNCAPENLEVPGSVLAHRPGRTVFPKFPVSESCACPARARHAWSPCRNRTSSRRRRGRCRSPSCRRMVSAGGGHFPS